MATIELGPDDVVVSRSTLKALLLLIEDDQVRRLKIMESVSRQMLAITGDLGEGEPATHFFSDGKIMEIRRRPPEERLQRASEAKRK